MKKRILLGLLIVALGITIITILVAANKYTDLSKSDLPKQELTENQKKHMEKVLEKRSKAWKDIVCGFAINESEYYKIDISKLNEFLQGEGDIQDTKITRSIVKNAINPYMDTLPIGSQMPLVFVSHDGNEVLFTYKEADGTNVMKKSVYENNEWTLEEKGIDGEKPMKIEAGQ